MLLAYLLLYTSCYMRAAGILVNALPNAGIPAAAYLYGDLSAMARASRSIS
jgi:hypothetical protein